MRSAIAFATLALAGAAALAHQPPAAASAPAASAASTTPAAGAAPTTGAAGEVQETSPQARSLPLALPATRALGAGPTVPLTDLQAPARRARIEQAYARWQSLRR